MRSEKTTFIGADTRSQLAARLDMPEETPRAFALFAHCFTCTHNVVAATRIAQELTRHGIAVLRFDFTGLGASEGEFANTNFSSNIGDLLAAAAWLRNTFEAPALLIGHSLGGAAVLVAANRIPEARIVATIAAPAEPSHVVRLFQPAVAEIEARGEAEVLLEGRPFRIRKQFLDDIDAYKLQQEVATLGRPLIIFHAPLDQIVGIDNAGRIFGAAKHPKSFISLDDGDHLLSRREDASFVASIISAWAERYVAREETSLVAPTVVPPAHTGMPQAEEGQVVVAEAGTGAGRFAQTISVGGRHTLSADEPRSVGGEDSAPNPYDLLLAALGACTSMTVRMYADRKQIPLGRISVALRHAKIHAADCADCETREGMVDHIEREVLLEGKLDADARAKLLEIANKCPVHRTLHGEVKVATKLAG
jgi:putative redox protein